MAPTSALRPQAAVDPTTRIGVAYAIAAYGLWGVFPVYFKLVKTVNPVEVLAHRVIWALAFLAILVTVRRNWRAARAVFQDRLSVVTLSVTTVLIACNWLVFIWAVAQNYVLQASLGYFINPLVNVLLGTLFLGERLRRWQRLAVGLAAVGVGYLTLAGGEFPGVALFLAATFGTYGLLRKIVRVEALIGLMIETLLLTPLAIIYLAYLMTRGEAAFGGPSLAMSLLLVLAGVVTATPLWWFAEAARRLRLATLGFIQYLAPTGHLLLAVFAFGEPFKLAHGIAFACIWTALLVYSLDAARSRRPAPATEPAIE